MGQRRFDADVASLVTSALVVAILGATVADSAAAQPARAVASLSQPTPMAEGTPAADRFAADFATAWQELDASYAYFDEKTTDWQAVHTLYGREVLEIVDEVAFLGLLERCLEELYDFHLNLSLRNDASPALVPAMADCWAEMVEGRPLVTAVRPATPAAWAGIRPGMEIVRIGPRPVVEALRDRLGRCGGRGDPAAVAWGLVALLAGSGDGPRAITLSTAGVEREFVLEPCPRPGREGPLVEHQVIDGRIGVLRFRDSLGDNATIGAFDEALDAVADTAGLILDLRDTPSGGNTTVARGIMGRLVAAEAAYQKHALSSEERRYGVRRSWLELVSPRGASPYAGPIVVLVDRWTASMGEGLAIGLDGLGRATVVGTRMAGLLGGTRSFTLPHTGIVMQYPVEKLFHVDGTPRADWVPPVEVDLRGNAAGATGAPAGATATAAGGEDTDPIYEAGLERLERLIGSGERPAAGTVDERR